MRKMELIAIALAVALAAAACGKRGKSEPETTPEETTAAFNAAAIVSASPEEERARAVLSEDQFLKAMDLLIADSSDKDSFFLTYKDQTYRYADMAALYDVIAKEGGKASVNFLGEGPDEALNFEILSMLLAMSDGSAEPVDIPEDKFMRYFDLYLEDNDISREDFALEHDGTTYRYDDLGSLYTVMQQAGGTIDARLADSETEEMLDFSIMSGYVDFMEQWNSDHDTTPVSQELISRYQGDWHGAIVFRDCTEKFKSMFDDKLVTSIARFIIDSEGGIASFIGLHVEDEPIEDLWAFLDAKDGCMYISGEWLGVPFVRIPVTEENGTLHFEIPIEKRAGSMRLVCNLRHLDDTGWTSEDPALPEDSVINCQGWSFDKLAEANGYDFWDYPHNEEDFPEDQVQAGEEAAESVTEQQAEEK